MFSWLFIFFDISLFSIISFPIYKLFCSEYDYEIIFFFKFYPIKYNNIIINSFFLDIGLSNNIWNTNLFSYILGYAFFLHNFVSLEFMFFIWSFFIHRTFFLFDPLLNLFDIVLYTRRTTLGIVEFYSLQKSIKVFVDEVSLIFFRIYNPVHYKYGNIFIYLVYPQYFGVYLSKIQCFCFEAIVVNAFEVLDLPVLFFLSSEIKLELISAFSRVGLLYVHFIM